MVRNSVKTKRIIFIFNKTKNNYDRINYRSWDYISSSIGYIFPN